MTLARIRRFTIPLALLLAAGISSGPAQTAAPGPRVVPVYLVPSDMRIVRRRLELTVRSLESVRQWYGRVLNGRTFRYDPLVVQLSRHAFQEFAADDFQAWWPLLQEEFRAYGQDWEDDDTKMLWIAHGAGAWAGADSENGGIDSIAEAGLVVDGDRGGLALIGDSTLGGYLAGVCPDSGRTGTAWWCSWYTFQGTVAHELGHTWGLPHPDAFLPGFRCADSTAWTNMQCHWGFPFDSLLPYEQAHLRSLRHFQFSPDLQYSLLSSVRAYGETIEVTDFARGDSLLWIDGRGGGTGYLWGLAVDRRFAIAGALGELVADIGLPRGARDSLTVELRIDGVVTRQWILRPGDQPQRVSIPIAPVQELSIWGTGGSSWGTRGFILGDNELEALLLTHSPAIF
jgi:Putative peptidase family